MSNVSFRRPQITDKVIDYRTFVSMQEWLERLANAAYSQDFLVSNTLAGVQIGLRKFSSADSFPWSKIGFGYGLNPDGDNPLEVIVYSGELHHGARTPIVVADTKGPMVDDTANQYVWLEYVFGAATAIVAGPSTAKPVTDVTTFRKWLFRFTAADGVTGLTAIGNMGNIVIPGAYA